MGHIKVTFHKLFQIQIIVSNQNVESSCTLHQKKYCEKLWIQDKSQGRGNITKQNKTKQNKTKQNKTKNKTKQNKTKQNKSKQNKTNQIKTNKTNQHKTNKHLNSDMIRLLLEVDTKILQRSLTIQSFLQVPLANCNWGASLPL